MSAFTEAAVVLCQTMHPDVRPLTTVLGATDPRLLVAACFACQRAAEALDSAGLLTCPTTPAEPDYVTCHCPRWPTPHLVEHGCPTTPEVSSE